MDLKNPLVRQKHTNNLYRAGLSMIYNRLKWDIQIESWRSKYKLRNLKNKYLNEKAVILCNGPSLLKTNLNDLEGVYSIGLNKINLLFDKSSFRPNSIVATNPHVIMQNKEFYNETDIDLFLSNSTNSMVRKRKNIFFLHTTINRFFSKDVSLSVYEGHTVTFVAMQLAFHLGFKYVSLVGCDHNFHDKGPSNMLVEAEGKDKNHFDPNYFANGAKWQLPDLFESEISYHMANKMFNAHDRKIFNSTEGGKLEVFERISLAEFKNL